MYTTECIPPRLYGTLKANKPEKLPHASKVSAIGSPPYGTLKYLVKITQPSLNKNRVLNSSSFVEEEKEWNISFS